MTTTYETGQRVFWSRVPEGVFTVRGMNPDGSVQLWGGEKGYGGVRDARVTEVSDRPFGGAKGDDKVAHWASQNIYEHIRVPELADMLDMPVWAVRRYVLDHPATFRRIERGLYEVRDEADDRAHGK